MSNDIKTIETIPFVESTAVRDNPAEIRRRLNRDGYLYFKNLLPKVEILKLRQDILTFCQEAGWLREGSQLTDGLTDIPPIREGDAAWKSVYAKIQALQSFHQTKLDATVQRIMEAIFQETVFALPMTISRIAFPRDNENATQPHQDWLYVGGSTETVSCWVPLGDIPLSVGGLKVLAGSHKAGFLPDRAASGPGGRTIDVDPSLSWHQSDYHAGDVLMFKALTVHAAAENHTPDKLRLSMDFRYSGISHTVTDIWLKPHYSWLGEPFSWETLEREWRDTPTAHYWEKLGKIKSKPHERFWKD